MGTYTKRKLKTQKEEKKLIKEQTTTSKNAYKKVMGNFAKRRLETKEPQPNKET